MSGEGYNFFYSGAILTKAKPVAPTNYNTS